MDSWSPKKSLRRPADNLPVEFSSVYVFAEDFGTLLSSYFQHPHLDTLNEVMLNYISVEDILKLYNDATYSYFESRVALDTLSQHFDLPRAEDFNELLKSYDCKYATVRSYHHKNRTPKKILIQAAREGNIQAIINGLKMYPELRVHKVYLEAATVGTFEGYAEILELFLDLGLTNYKRLSLAAARGGHLALIKRLRELDDTKPCPLMFGSAASGSHVEVLDYLLSLTDLPNLKVLGMISFGAGENGSMEMIKYSIEKGGHTGQSLSGAARAGHLELVKKLAPEANPLAYSEAAGEAVDGGHLEVVKYFVEELQQTHVAISGIEDAAQAAKVDIFFYFVGKGVNTAGQDLLLAAADGNDLRIMEFLLQQPREVRDLAAALEIVLQYPSRYRREKREVVHLLARQLQVQGQRPEELQKAILKPFRDGVFEGRLYEVQSLAPYISTEELNSALQAKVEDGKVKDYLISLLASRKDL